MIRHIRWQILLVLVGVGILIALLIRVALNFTTIWVPSRGGTYVEGLAGTPQFINPLLCQTYEADGDLCALIFNGLTRIDYHGQIEPDLALDWEISDDGLTYTFHLRPGTRWQDGTLVTAQDVVFTYRLLQDPNYPGRPDWGELWRTVTVTEVDNRTVQFELSEPFAPFLDYTTVGILPHHLLGDVPAAELPNHPFNLNPVGTNAYQISEVVTAGSTAPASRTSIPDSGARAQAEGTEATGRIAHVILETNPYHRGTRPLIDRIQFKFYPSYQAVYQAYLDGEVQGIGRVAPENLAAARADPNLQLFTSALPQYSLIYLNLASETAPFFAEREVRQALLYALDRQALIDRVLDGQAIVAHNPVLPDSWAYDPTVLKYEHDPQRAIALLEEAGWQMTGVEAAPAVSDTAAITSASGAPTVNAWFKEGRPLSFSLLVADSPQRVAVAQEIARQWALIGIQANVEPVATGLLNERLQPRHYQAALVNLDLTLSGDPDPYPFWHQTQIEPPGQNYAGYDDRDMSELLEAARQTVDQQARKELYYEFQQRFAREALALLLYYPVYTYAVDQDVGGVHVGPIVRPGDRFLGIADWYVHLRRVIRSAAAAEGSELASP